MFFIGITVVLVLFLAAVSFGVLLSQPQQIPTAMVFNEPKVNINMQVFDSDQFKGLQPFPEMGIQYSYKATTGGNKPIEGFISAASVDQANTFLESMGLNVSELKAIEAGRIILSPHIISRLRRQLLERNQQYHKIKVQQHNKS